MTAGGAEIEPLGQAPGCNCFKTDWAWLRMLTSPDWVSPSISGLERSCQFGRSVGQGGMEGLEGFELDGLDLALLLGACWGCR